MNVRGLRRIGVLIMLSACAWSADQVWNGGGASDNWTSNQNWGNNPEPNGSGDGATMAGSTRPTPNLDANVTLNRLTFAAGAGNFTIGGGSTLTMAGTSPLIEVLAGTQIISCDVSLSADVTVYVAAGASLTISDTALGGTGRITKIGTGTLSVTDAATPAMPSWVAPASNGQTTTSATPTWTWSGGGSGTFRYRLDSGGWVDTTSTSFTPSAALANGSHSLDVEAYSRLGALSPTATRSWNVSVDATPPFIVTRTTRDLDADGFIDAIDVTFSEAMSTAQLGTWTVAGYTVGTPAWQAGNTVLRLPLTELSVYDTAATPAVRYTAGSVQDAAGNALPVEASASPAADGAAPVIVRAAGTTGSTALTLVFSEGVATSTSGGNLVVADLAYGNVSAGGATSISAVAQGDATGGSAVFTVNAAFAAGDFGSDTVAAATAASIYDLAGNAMGTATRTLAAAPAAPGFSAPGATTNDSTPTWTWSSGGGAGTYRFRLDSSDLSTGATTTTATSFTPGAALGDGSHTLYLQERDAFGVWSATASRAVTIDATAPQILSRTTRDLDGDGQLDAIDVAFSEAMSGAQMGTWTVSGYTPGTPAWQSTTLLRIPLTELANPDTGALPSVRYVSGSVQDVVGNLLATEGAGTAAVDGASPVLLTATGGGGASTSATITFSEPVVTSATGTGNLVVADFTYTGAGGSIVGLADANGLDQSVTITTSASINLGSDTVAAAANQIFDLSGNAMGTAARVIAAPVTTKETVAAGDWNTGSTWQGGTVPGSTDNVVIRHAVTIAQSGTSSLYLQVNTITFDTGGSLAATNDVSNNIYYYTIVYPTARIIEAKANATVTNVQFYDGSSPNSGIETVYKVGSGCILTLNNATQGHFTGSVIKQGAGELVWNSPANGFSGYDWGPTRVEAGTLRLVKPGARPDGYDLNVFGSATIDLQQNLSVSALAGQGTITRSTSGTTLLGIGGGTWGGAIQDGGSGGVLRVALSGTNIWTGTNTCTGGLVLTSGSLSVAGTSAIADTCAVDLAAGTTFTVNDPETAGPLSGAGNVVLNAALTANQAAQSTTVSGSISGAGGLLLSGSGGTLTLSGGNSYGGGTTVRTGATLSIASGANVGAAAGAFAFDGGTLSLTGNVNFSSVIATSTADGTSSPVTIAAAAADRPVSVSANGGTIRLGLSSIGLPAFATAAGQDLTIRTDAANAGTVFVNVASGTTVWAGKLLLAGSNAFGFFIKRGAGTLELSNPGNTWSKNIVRPEEGTLRISADGALGTVGSWVYTLAGATFELASNYSSGVTHYVAGTMRVSAGSANWGGETFTYPKVTPATNTPTFDVASGATLNLSGRFTYSQPWAKTGPGTLILSSGSGVNASLTAAGTISGGTLQIARDDLLGAAANGLTLQGGATLAVTAGFTSSRAMTLGSGGGIVDVAASQTLTWSGTVGGGNALTKNGAGTLVLGSTGNGQSATTVNAGVLRVASNGALGAASAGVTLAGGTFAATASFTAAATHGLALAAASTIDVATGITLDWPGVVSGGGALTKTSTGILALSGANTFTGALDITAGTVQAGAIAALGTAAGGTAVADGAILQFAGSLGSLGTIAEPLTLTGDGGGTGALAVLSGTSATLSGTVALAQGVNGSATISVAGSPGLTLGGVVSGNGGLKAIGGGTLTLANGGNNFRGSILVTGGSTLQSGSDAAFGVSTNDLTFDGGTLALTGGITTARTISVGSNDATVATGAGLVLEASTDFNTASGQDLTITGSGTVRLNPSGASTSTIGGALHGTGNLRKSGPAASVLVLAGNDDMTGTVTVDGGVLRANGTHTGAVSVAAGGTLAGTGSVGPVSVASGGIIRPAGSATAGILTVAGLTVNTGATLDYDLGITNDLINCTGSVTIQNGVDLTVSGSPANASFGDGAYTLVSASTGLTYGGGMAATLPNGYSTSSGSKRAVIAASGDALVLTADSTEPVVAAITSASPDGTYYQGQSFGVTVQFSKPITPTGAVTAQLALTNGGTPVLRSVTVSAGSYPATQLTGSYTVLSGDITAPGEVNAADVILAGSITDAVGHSVTGTLSTAGTLSSNKNIIIDNFVPLVQVHTAAAGNTQPPAVAMNTLEARVFNSTGSTADEVLVVASDQETSDPALFAYRILLEPSQGQVQLLAAGTWTSGTIMRVVNTVTDAGTQVGTFTQADIDAGAVRYKHTLLSGGNDAILFDVTDGDGKTSALYLLRFTVSGNAVPTIAGLPASLVYAEEATHAVWAPLTTAADITDNDATFPGGVLSIAMTGAQAGDQLDLRPDATGVSEGGGRISVGAVEVGALTRLSATSLLVQFDDPTTAGPAAAAAIINAIGYRTTSSAPDPTAARTIQVSITDGSLGQIANVYVVPVQIELYNDPPVVTVGAAIATVPGLARTITVSVVDPEGETALTCAIAAPPAPQATRGALVQTSPGVFTYTPYYPADSAVGDVLQDIFAITVTDVDFDPGASDPRRRGTAPAATSPPAAYTVRIADGAGAAPRFRAPMRMTVAAGLPFFFQPDVEAAAGAALTWELVGAPAQLTAAIGASEASFDEASGQLSWPAVPAPGDGSGYFRFGILVTDTTSRTATLLPVMLRVGPGGAG